MSIGLTVEELNTSFPVVVAARSGNGSPQTGRNIRANVYNADTGALILDQTQIQFTEILPGIYRYVFPVNLPSPTNVFIEVGQANNNNTRLDLIDTMQVRFTDFKQYLTDKTDENDGRAV